MLVAILLPADFPPKSTLSKNYLINKTISECVKYQVKHFFSLDMGPNCLQRLSADDTNRLYIEYPTHINGRGAHSLLYSFHTLDATFDPLEGTKQF